MDLQMLLARAEEIDKAIASLANQLNVLNGHKGETAYWIEQQMKASAEEADKPGVEYKEEPVVE